MPTPPLLAPTCRACPPRCRGAPATCRTRPICYGACSSTACRSCRGLAPRAKGRRPKVGRGARARNATRTVSPCSEGRTCATHRGRTTYAQIGATRPVVASMAWPAPTSTCGLAGSGVCRTVVATCGHGATRPKGTGSGASPVGLCADAFRAHPLAPRPSSLDHEGSGDPTALPMS